MSGGVAKIVAFRKVRKRCRKQGIQATVDRNARTAKRAQSGEVRTPTARPEATDRGRAEFAQANDAYVDELCLVVFRILMNERFPEHG